MASDTPPEPEDRSPLPDPGTQSDGDRKPATRTGTPGVFAHLYAAIMVVVSGSLLYLFATGGYDTLVVDDGSVIGYSIVVLLLVSAGIVSASGAVLTWLGSPKGQVLGAVVVVLLITVGVYVFMSGGSLTAVAGMLGGSIAIFLFSQEAGKERKYGGSDRSATFSAGVGAWLGQERGGSGLWSRLHAGLFFMFSTVILVFGVSILYDGLFGVASPNVESIVFGGVVVGVGLVAAGAAFAALSGAVWAPVVTGVIGIVAAVFGGWAGAEDVLYAVFFAVPGAVGILLAWRAHLELRDAVP